MNGDDSVSYTSRAIYIGLDLVYIEYFADLVLDQTEIQDTLLREPDCYWGRSPYSRPLTADDIDPAGIDENQKHKYNVEAQARINDRKEYMERVAREAVEAENEPSSRCTML